MEEKGGPLKGEIVDIDGITINSYNFHCKPANQQILWWYDGEVSRKLIIFGDENIQEAKND